MIPVQHTVDTPYLVGAAHFYSCEINGELILLDTGSPTDATKAYIEEHIDLARLKYVFISHCHIDHFGLSAWLEEVSDATVYLSARDHLRLSNQQSHLDGLYELMHCAGFDKSFIAGFRDCITGPDMVYPTYPTRYKFLEDGLPSQLGLTALHCPGHTQGDMAICGRDWALTGDIMLRQIFQSPLLDVDLKTGRRFNNYEAYCDSLKNIASLRDKTILPGHRETIDSVNESLSFYLGKLLDRALRLKDFPRTSSPCDIVTGLFGLDFEYPFASYAKASEIIFLRDFLNDPDRLFQASKGIDIYPDIAGKFELAVAA